MRSIWLRTLTSIHFAIEKTSRSCFRIWRGKLLHNRRRSDDQKAILSNWGFCVVRADEGATQLATFSVVGAVAQKQEFREGNFGPKRPSPAQASESDVAWACNS